MTRRAPVWREEARAAVRETLVRCGQRYDQSPTTRFDTRMMFAPPAHEVALALREMMVLGVACSEVGPISRVMTFSEPFLQGT